jgi:AMMECR1 domain-containing protein
MKKTLNRKVKCKSYISVLNKKALVFVHLQHHGEQRGKGSAGTGGRMTNLTTTHSENIDRGL